MQLPNLTLLFIMTTVAWALQNEYVKCRSPYISETETACSKAHGKYVRCKSKWSIENKDIFCDLSNGADQATFEKACDDGRYKYVVPSCEDDSYPGTIGYVTVATKPDFKGESDEFEVSPHKCRTFTSTFQDDISSVQPNEYMICSFYTGTKCRGTKILSDVIYPGKPDLSVYSAPVDNNLRSVKCYSRTE